MQALASYETVTPSGSHPTDEELAAYIDRRLGEKDRARVTGHLASCDRCYSIFSGVVRFQLEEEEMGKSSAGEVIPFDKETRGRRRHWWIPATTAASEVASMGRMAGGLRRWWIPSTIAAALALLGIGVGSTLWSRPMALAKLVAPIEGRKEVTSRLWDYADYRGPGDDDSLESDAYPSVQAGALFVDFRLAAEAGDTKTAFKIWHRIGNAVEKTILGDGEAQSFYAEATAIQEEGKLPQVLASLPKRERHLEGEKVVYLEYFRLGKWVEAGRLAAELREPKFFDRWANWIFLKNTLANEEMNLPPEVRRELEAIRDAWGTKDYTGLAGHFQSILDHYDFRS